MSTEPATLGDFERPPLDVLTHAEREAYEAVEIGDVSGREFARRTDRSWGTVSNLLMRAREKLAKEGWV